MRTVAVASLALALIAGSVEAFAPTSARSGVTSTALSAYVPDGFTAESYKKVCEMDYRTLVCTKGHLLTILLPPARSSRKRKRPKRRRKRTWGAWAHEDSSHDRCKVSKKPWNVVRRNTCCQYSTPRRESRRENSRWRTFPTCSVVGPGITPTSREPKRRGGSSLTRITPEADSAKSRAYRSLDMGKASIGQDRDLAKALRNLFLVPLPSLAGTTRHQMCTR
jgi:hypothetical protein